MKRPVVVAAGAAAALAVVAGCTSSATPARTSPAWSPKPTPTSTSATTSTPSKMSTPTRTSAPTSRGRPTPTRTATASTDAMHVLESMTEAQRVGQLFMVGASSTGPDTATMRAISLDHVGSVILTGTSDGGVDAIAAVNHDLQAAAGKAARLFIAADQEGGEVQRLQGPGFDTIPSATQQGTLTPKQLRADARRWGAQLRAAGVNLNLAPVVDTVPDGTPNAPIGAMFREYGSVPATVAAHGIAFAQGLGDAGVDATIKHFPGLGRVVGNTDTTAGVTDRITTRHDPFLAPFADAIKAGVPFVMMATADYVRIDPAHPAAFSPTIVTGMLRGDLGFGGVVISDDLGGAAQVAAYSPAARALDFVAAGGDIVLTVNAAQIPEMTAAVLAAAKADSRFRAQVDAAALRVLTAKQARGLLA